MIFIFHSTVVNCSTLADPDNGQVNQTTGTTFGQAATYSCDAGYDLEGNSTRMCQATGMWSGNETTCQSEPINYHTYSKRINIGV